MSAPTPRALMPGLMLLASACSTGPERLDLTGTWEGTTLLTDPFMATLSIVQSGATLTGNLTIAELLDGPFVGAVNETTRVLTWNVFSGCEQWSGTFDVNSDGTEMAGPVLNDVSACGTGSDSSGTITLSKW